MLWPAWVAAVDELLAAEEETAAEEVAVEEAAPGEEAAEEETAPPAEEEQEVRLLPFRARDAWLETGTFGLADGVGADFPLHFQNWVLLDDADPGPWLGDWRDVAGEARYYYKSGFEEPFDRGLMAESYRLIKEEEEFYAWEQERGLIPDIELGRESDIKFEGRKLFSAGYSKTSYGGGGSPIYGGGQPAGDFQMEGELQLRVEGTVLRKTHVYVDYDDTRENETRNQVSVVYKGDPDELVQEAAFGDIVLSLPATEFVSYSSSRAVFGAKVDLKYKWARLMAIASREKGETERATFTGGTELRSVNVADTNYTRRRFFQIDPSYDPGTGREFFARYDIYKPSEGASPKVEVFVRAGGYFPQGKTKFLVTAYEFEDDTEQRKGAAILSDAPCERLVRGTDYDVDVDAGIIRFNKTISESDIVAVAYVAYNESTGDYIRIGYDTSNNLAQADAGGGDIRITKDLKCLRKATKSGGDRNLERYEQRNWYYLGSTNIESNTLVVKLLDNNNNEFDPRTNREKTYLYTYGLDRDEDGRLDSGTLHNAWGYVVVPDVDFENNFARRDRREDDIYENLPFDYDDNGSATGKDAYEPETINELKFYFEYKSLKPSYFLHPNIIPGSETVKLNGRILVRNQDYWMDYDSGFLEILAEGADDPTATLEVTYEYKPLFTVLAKSLVGGRFQFGPDDDRYLGTTLIAEFTTKPPAEEIPNLEEAPDDHVIFDLDGRYRLYPEFMTTLADAVPGAHTTEGSTFDVHAEYARSVKKINTVGRALVDDMEGARQLLTLPMKAEAWKHTSPSAAAGIDQSNRGNHLLDIKSDPDHFWSAVDPDWPDDQLEVLLLERLPDNPENVGPPEKNYKWGGVHRVLSPTGLDFADTRYEYVEIVMNLNNLTRDTAGDDVAGGILHLDLGTISEDADGNQILGTEDEDDDGEITQAEDIGYEFNNRATGQPPGGIPPDPPGNIEVTIGARNNRLDTEDNNRNGVLDREDNYFRYEIDLGEVVNKTSPYVIRHEASKDPLQPGWYILRLPLEFDTAEAQGAPDPSSLQTFRLWAEAETRADFPLNSSLIFASVSFAALRWEDPEVDPDKGLNQMKVSTKDSRHDGDYVPHDPKTERETGAEAREQALVLEYILTDWEDVGVSTQEGFEPWGAGNDVFDTEDLDHDGLLDPGEDVGVGPFHFGAG
ncbi:MAG: hypothetical protein JSU81_07035, partial [Candidatus Coatesbacteria bacterium]